MSRRTLTEAEREQLRYTWLTPAQIGPRLGGVGAAKVRELIQAGQLRALNINPTGRAEYRIKPEWVDEYLDAHTLDPQESGRGVEREPDAAA